MIPRLPMTTSRSTIRRGFTLLEMLVTISIIAVAAVLVAPAFNDDARLRLTAASSVLSSDIELAQVMNISYPASPVIVRFEPENQRYWLAYADTPDTPLTREVNGQPYLVEFGVGRASSAADVTFTVDQMTDDTLAFNAQGGLTNYQVTPTIELCRADSAVTLSVAPTTGTVTESAMISKKH